MSLSARAAEALATESAHWPDVEYGLDTLLLDRQRMAWIREAAYYFTHILDTIVHRHRAFPASGSPVFLLDFDVILEFLSVKGSVSPRSLAVDAFFNSTEYAFAIPLGSFLELLNWLNRAHLHRLPEERNYSPEETVHLLAERLSLNYKSASDTLSARRAVSESVDDDVVQVNRLIGLLESSRFRGIWGTFLEDDRQRLLPYVRSIARYDERGRFDEAERIRKERRDQRDALNLSVTCYAIRSRLEDGVLLVTNTRDLADLAEHFSIEHRDFESFQAVMDSLLILNGEPVAQRFPVVSPFDVWIWQLMLRHAALSPQHSPLIQTRQAFHRLKESFDEALGMNLEGFALARAQGRARQALRSVATLTADAGSPIGSFVHFSLSEAAIRQGRRLFALKRSELSVSTDDAEKYLMLARLLHQLGALVTKERNKVLQCQSSALPRSAEDPTKSLGTRFLVSMGGSAETGVSVFDGEIYRQSAGGTFCAIRWPVICRVHTFFMATRSVLRQRKILGRPYGKEGLPKFVRARADSRFWQSGVIAYTSLGAWGTDLELVFQPRHWDQLVDRFQEGALYSFADIPQKEFISKTGDLPEVLALRINSAIGDFVYDVVPIDQESTQCMTFLSHAPKVADVVKLMSRTSSRFVLDADMSQLLENLFGSAEFAR